MDIVLTVILVLGMLITEYFLILRSMKTHDTKELMEFTFNGKFWRFEVLRLPAEMEGQDDYLSFVLTTGRYEDDDDDDKDGGIPVLVKVRS